MIILRILAVLVFLFVLLVGGFWAAMGSLIVMSVVAVLLGYDPD